jgi:Ca2+-binding RTX toxin-like protein
LLAKSLHLGYLRKVVAPDSHPARAARTFAVLACALALAGIIPGVASAAVTATFSAGALTATSNAAESISVDCVSGSALVLGNAAMVPITPVTPACSQVQSITVAGGTGNTLVLNGIGAGEFANLTGPITINGGTGTDTIQGSQVADAIAGGGGADTMEANGGNDTLTDSSNLDSFNGGLGTDTLNCTVGISFFMVGATTITHDAGDWTYASIEIVNASSKNSDSSYDAQNANFRLNASSSFADKNDSFVTGPFNDSFNGGPAFIADTIVAHTDSPLLTLTNTSLVGTTTGTDALADIEAGAFTSLGGNVANTWDASGFTPGLNDNVSMTSGPGNDILIGTSASDALNGEDGDDILSGRGGNESGPSNTLTGGNGTDTARETGVTSATVTATGMSTNFGNDTFSSIEAVDLTGTGADETFNVTSFAGNVRFDGAGGADTLNAAVGNDELIGGPGVDTFSGGDGNDTIRANDATVDGTIACGTGQDTAIVDKDDVVQSDCETVTVPQPPGGTGGPGGPVGGSGNPVVDILAPVVSMELATRRFSAASRGASFAAAVGSRVTYRLSERASARFTVERARPGRRAGGRCAKPKRSNRAGRRCTRWVPVKGSFTQQGLAGANSFRFTGRVGGRKLRLGRHRLVLVATDLAGNRAAAVRAAFRIVPRR